MTALTDERLDATFAALANSTRRAILARLAAGEATVNELAEPFPITLQAVSKHLKVLERAGLIARGRTAQLRPSRLQGAPLGATWGESPTISPGFFAYGLSWRLVIACAALRASPSPAGLTLG